MSGQQLVWPGEHLAVEQDRERRCQQVKCPVCHEPAGVPCTYGGLCEREWSWYSHTGRYNLAAATGLVPEIGGAQ